MAEEKEKIIRDQRTQIVYMPGAKALVKSSVGTATPTTTRVENPAGTYGKIAPWGVSNDFPQKVAAEIEVSTIVNTTLFKQARLLYGGGLEYGKYEINEKGEKIFKPILDYKPWNDFKKASNINAYLRQSTMDYTLFYNPFPEMLMSKNRKYINSLKAHQASWCRWEIQDSDGVIQNCFINGNFGTQYYNEKENKVVKVLDPLYNAVEAARERDDAYKYIYPLSQPSPGKAYYSLAHWNSLRSSGWLDYSQAIINIKRNSLKNVLDVGYLIEVADWYWKWKFPEWENLKNDEAQVLMDQEYQRFNDFVSGAENAGKSLFVPMATDPNSMENYPGWKITPVSKSGNDGKLLEDSYEAGTHLAYACGLDPTIIGMTPGKGTGAGSGSDKRVALNIYESCIQADRDIITEPFYFIRDFNGWDPEGEFRLMMPAINTLDTGAETTKKAN